ncbi:MAG TPA: tRNA pseudouridine(55) synthase TruB [Gaiellaceae bacterium]|jgi:tRNA pseudouridine55 synthase
MSAERHVKAGGLVLVDKPAGPSSFALVRDARRRFGLKAGHAGTLDPFATGLLLVLLGPATRLARYLVGLDKRYVAEIRLGRRTTTGDPEGDVLEETAVAQLADVEALRGEVELPVPQASAVKIDGERAYRLHRRGVAVEMPLRRSTIHGLDVLRYDPPELVLDLHVSSGTYVRSIADALAGHCTGLRRTAVGPFRIEDADAERLLPPLAAAVHLPSRALTDEERARVVQGGRIGGSATGPTALVHGGELVAVGVPSGDAVQPETVLA